MKNLLFFFTASVSLIVMSTTAIAQKQMITHIDWKVATVLPPAPGTDKQHGLAGVVAGIINDVLIVAGGANFPDSMPWLGGKKKYYNEIYIFKKDGEGNLIHSDKIFRLPYPVAYAASCSAAQGVVCAGGENDNGITNKVLLLQWNESKNDILIKNLPDLPVAVTNASITYDNNKVFVAGGETVNSVSNQFFSLDLNNMPAGWKLLPSLPKPVSHAVMVVQSRGDDKCIYLIGGRKKNTSGISDLYSSVYTYDLKSNHWQQKQSLPYTLSAGTGIAAGANSILLFGGDRGETFHKTEELIVAINAEKDEAKKQQLIRQKAELQASHPGFSKEVLQYNTIVNNWKAIDTIPFEVPATTTAVKWNRCVIIPSGEIKAGVRTPQILVGKMTDNLQISK